MKKLIKYLPLVVLLFVAATLIFSIALIPAVIVSLKLINIEFIILALLVIMSTVASLVALMIYIILSKKGR